MTIKEFFDKQKWTWAKKYEKFAPHYWIVRNRINGSDEEFMWAAGFIQRHGAPMYYYSHPNRYLYLDGWWYWVMKDSDDDPTMIINRCWADDYFVSTKYRGNSTKNGNDV